MTEEVRRRSLEKKKDFLKCHLFGFGPFDKTVTFALHAC